MAKNTGRGYRKGAVKGRSEFKAGKTGSSETPPPAASSTAARSNTRASETRRRPNERSSPTGVGAVR